MIQDVSLRDNEVIITKNQYANFIIAEINKQKEIDEAIDKELKQFGKDVAYEILKEIRGYYPGKKENCNKGELFIIELCEDIAKRYEVDLNNDNT